MNHFSIFVILYATAFLMEMLEKWKHPEFSWMALGIVILLIFTRITKLKFLIFLFLTTGYFFIFHFPDVANHVNLLIYLNIALIVGGVYHYFISGKNHSAEQNNQYWEIMLPILRSTLILVYFLAGFHKLNQDFFNPKVSCAKVFFLRLVKAIRTEFLSFPLFFWLIAIFLLFLGYFLSQKSAFLIKNKSFNLFFLGMLLPISWGISSLLQAHSSFLSSLIPIIGFLTAIVVIIWEILGGLLLSVSKLQLSILIFSLMMHLILAPIGFVDFAALALALLFTFVPQNYYQILINSIYIKMFDVKINRIYIYFLLNTLGGLIAGVNYRIYSIPNIRIITGFLFDISVLILIYPLVSVILLPVAKRPTWAGVSLVNSKMPKFMCLLPLFLVMFGFSSYFGLGTAGNFSMFSNLRTEGTTSNHLLLSQNPFKVFKYQEDTVKIHVAFTEKNGRRSNRKLNNRRLKGHSLPLVEFKKLIYNWTQTKQKVSMMFKYQGESYLTRDIVNDPTWKTTQRNWEMKLMNFRLISPNQPNECRW